jgi:hypothetical protein
VPSFRPLTAGPTRARAWHGVAASAGGHEQNEAASHDMGPVHLAYNPSYLAYFFSQNNIFLSQKISQQYFSVGL